MANPSAHTAAVLPCISASPAVEEVMFATTTKGALLASSNQEDGNVWKVVDKDNPNPDPEDEEVGDWRRYRNFFSLVKGRSTS
jgi:hypothetical protein